ncbi:Asp23/Gls24 family envelope stress response protein [Lentzea sp. NPDC102401]|uniref:Asp23/Gls24 family envelope stress response protein n=1 Tax=Lentzea sp. NPDC102401 TaxID=3364128 RepID=UPI0038082664
MTATIPALLTAMPQRDSGPREVADASERGALWISEEVVARVAGHAVREVDGVGGADGQVLGVSLGGKTPAPAAKVSAHVAGDTATLTVRLSLTYPAPVARTVQRVREHVVRRVGELTGLSVTRVDIVVTALHNATGTRRRRVE